MIKKLSVKSIIIFILVALVLMYLYQSDVAAKSGYAPPPSAPKGYPVMMVDDKKGGKKSADGSGGIMGMDVGDDSIYAPADLSGSINLDIGCSMKAGTGLSSSLMPREVASQEDYAQFAPNDILRGTIRNGNHDLRADPPNPKDSYTWNNSTIVPDLMQRNLFCN